MHANKMQFILFFLGFVGISLASAPVVENVTLNSTSGYYLSADNLTASWDAYDADMDDVRNITNWYLDGLSITEVNLAFEPNGSGNATDYSNNSRHGAVEGTPTYNATGGFDGSGAFEFDGSAGNGINLGAWNISSAAFSVEAWYEAYDTTSYIAGIVTKWDTDAKGSWGLVTLNNLPTGNMPALCVGNGTERNCIKTQAPQSYGVWHHVVATYDGKNHAAPDYGIKIYMDGSEVITNNFYSGAPSGQVLQTNASVYVGRSVYQSTSDTYFNGSIDDVRIYSRELSAEQVLALYNNRTGLIVSQETSSDDAWMACVTPNDGTQDGLTNCSDTLTLGRDVTGCQDITSEGTYVLLNNLSGANVSSAGSLACIRINASNVILNCNGYKISNNGTTGATYGILIEGAAGGAKVQDCPMVTGYSAGAHVRNSQGVNIDPSYFCGNDFGLLVNLSNNSIIADSVACNNSLGGIYVLDSQNTSVEGSRMFNNGHDLLVDNGLAAAANLSLENAVFDNPSGSQENYTALDINDSVLAETSYFINWTAKPSALPPYQKSFEGKYVEITNLTSGVSIDSAVWRWEALESSAYNETLFALWEWDGAAWDRTGATLDAGANTMAITNLVPQSDYAILEDTANKITACTLITGNGTYVLNQSISGAPFSASPLTGVACIRINASDVVFDCNGYNISHTVTSNTYGVLAAQGLTNVTIRNCNIYNFSHSAYFYDVDNSVLEYNVMTNFQTYAFWSNSLSDNNVIRGNNASRMTSGLHGFRIEGNGSNISWNRVAGLTAGYAFYDAVGGDYNSYVQNTAVNCQRGFYLLNTQYNRLENNTVSGGNEGVYLSAGTGALVAGNNISDRTYGIYVLNSHSNATVKENRIHNCSTMAIYGNAASSIVIHNNTLNLGAFGIDIIGNSDNANITFNRISNFSRGIYISDTATDNTTIANNDVFDNSLGGIYIQAAGSVLCDNEVHDNAGAGVVINNTANANLSGMHLYSNSPDLSAVATASARNIYLNGVIFDNPAGDYADFTNLTISDSINPNSHYNLSFAVNVSETPHPPFRNKFVNITRGPDATSIDTISWKYSADEAAGYDEDGLELWEWNGAAWSHFSAAVLNTGTKTITATNFAVPSSLRTYGILEVNQITCQLINSPGEYGLVADAANAPISVGNAGFISNACVVIASSDVVFDCNGYKINNSAGVTNSAGIIVNGSASVDYTNVTIRNCPGISSYNYGVVLLDTSEDAIDSVSVYESKATGGYGIYVASSSSCNVTHSNSSFNALNGFSVVSSSNIRLSENMARNNTGTGFTIAGGSVNELSGNAAYNNTLDGFYVSSPGSTLFQNDALDNAANGFDISGSGANLTSNDAFSNLGNGIEISITGGGSRLAGNWAYNNALTGIQISADDVLAIGSKAYNNSVGVELLSVSNTNLSGTVSSGNSQYGLRINAITDVYLIDTHLFNNTRDFGAAAGDIYANGATYHSKNMTFDWWLGDGDKSTTLDIYDNITGLDVDYSISWSSAPIYFPLNLTSMDRHKFIKIINSQPTVIDAVNWTWQDWEFDANQESNLDIYEVTTSGTETTISDLDASVNTAQNYAEILDLTPHRVSTYGVLSRSLQTVHCGDIITESGLYVWDDPTGPGTPLDSSPLPGAPKLVALGEACIQIQATDVELYCSEQVDGKADLAPGAADMFFVFIDEGSQNIRIRDCDIISLRGAVAAVPDTDNITLENVDLFDMGAGADPIIGFQFFGVNNLKVNNSIVEGPDNPRVRAGYHLYKVTNADLNDISIRRTGEGEISVENFDESDPGIGYYASGGLMIDQSENVSLNRIELFDNLHDLHVKDTSNIVAQDLILSDPNQAKRQYVDFNDAYSEEGYYIDWSGENYWNYPALRLYEGSGDLGTSIHIEKEDPPGELQFDSFTLQWEDARLDGLNSNFLEILYYLYKSELDEVGEVASIRDTGANTLTASDFVIENNSIDLGMVESHVIFSCKDITVPGSYRLNSDITGVQGGGKNYCLRVTADDVTIYLDGHSIIQNSEYYHTGVGIYYVDCERPAVVGKPPDGVFGYAKGIDTFRVSLPTFDPINLCNNTIGMVLNQTNGSIIDEITFCNNTQIGLYILDSDNTTINRSRTYNNGFDLHVENNLGSPVDLTVTSLVFDNPSGDGTQATDVYMTDSVAAGTLYDISWYSEPEPPPSGMASFEQKYVEISGDGPIDSISFHWSDEESIYRGYDENLLQLWEHTTFWGQLTAAVLDTVANTLTYTNLNPSSEYGLLYNGTPGTPIELYGANVTNASTYARYSGTAAGNISTEGGNISGVNISSTQLTGRWAAFFGNVTGSIFLRDAASSNYVYSWAWSPADGGAVCLSTNSSLASFNAYPALGSDIDTAWAFTPNVTDSGANTFSSTNCTLDIGMSGVSNASYADTGSAGGFITCAIKSAATPAKPEMMFCSEILSGGTAWNSDSVDFEVIVPTNETAGSTETYYFYANLD